MIFRGVIMKKISRLRRNHFAEDMYSIPMGVVFKDFDQKIDNDRIDDIEYGTTNSKEWEFEKLRDNQEWALQTSFTKNL
jgi:hypothetical protein